MEEKIRELQMMEQQLQNINAQKRQFQSEAFEADSALTEMKPPVYKIIGNIMVSTDTEVLKKELTEKKEIAELRIKSLEKQEKSIAEKASSLQKEVMEKMKNERAK